MNTFTHRAVLSAGLVLAAMAATSHAQAQVSYDFSQATLASGPAGQIGTNVWFTTPDSGGALTLGMTKYQQGQGCALSGCADGIGGGVTATLGGSLNYDLKDTPVGDVKALIATSSHTSAEVDHKAFISGYAISGLYTNLTNAASTSFAFIFSGHSAAAGQAVQIQLSLNDSLASLFSQTATSNNAGDWQLVIDTPVGINLMGTELHFSIGAASGANTLSSLLITPHLVAVPEPATWALMGLGLIGLGSLKRARHRDRRHG